MAPKACGKGSVLTAVVVLRQSWQIAAFASQGVCVTLWRVAVGLDGMCTHVGLVGV